MAGLLLATRATPLMYYGEELGMRTTEPAHKEDVQDPIGKIGWPEEKGRDGERTPMQWDASTNAGFSTSQHPWLPVPLSGAAYNVQTESQDPRSILSFYKRLLALRRTDPALWSGRYLPLNQEDPYVLSFLRKKPGSGDAVLVVLNMSGEARTVKFELAASGVKDSSAKPLLAAPEIGPEATQLAHFTVPAFGVFIGAVR
jgi:alpha-glucosidase